MDDSDSQFSRSFLDVIACAFGAVVLLVLILPIGVPEESRKSSFEFNPSELESKLNTLNNQITDAGTSNAAMNMEIATIEQTIQSLSADASSKAAKFAKLQSEYESVVKLNQALKSSLDKQKKAGSHKKVIQPERENQYFGIPVDADYVIFVIDTSPSMKAIRSSVSRLVKNVLALYPPLKGIQVINDQGYRLSGANSKLWLEDSKKMRSSVGSRIKDWHPQSNSSPIEGITIAMDSYVKRNKRTAIFILGDDYTGSSFDIFLKKIESIVRKKSIDRGNLRIHAIGFESPALFPERFGMLMRALTHHYNGAYLYVPTSPVKPLDIRRGSKVTLKE